MKDLSDIFDTHKKLVVAFIDGVRNEAYQQGRAEAIDNYNKELKSYLRRFSVHSVSDADFDLIAEQLKEKNNED